jgi:hypothetical protein
LGVELVERRRLERARVVDEHVERAERRHGPLDEPPDLVELADVGHLRLDGESLRLQAAHRVTQGDRVDVVDQHRGAGLEHAQGGGIADAPRPAGDQRMPPGQAERIRDPGGLAFEGGRAGRGDRHARPTIDTKLTISPG